MSLRLRAGTYHADVMVNGQRIRQTLRTSDWREAKRREQDLIKDAKEGMVASKREDFGRKPFSEALDKYVEEATPRLQPLSVRSEKERGRRLKEFFAPLPLAKITPDSIRDYVTHRKAQGAGNRTCNMECGLLRRLLKRAKLWRRFADDYKPLPQAQDIGRAMMPDEEARLAKTCQKRPEWRNARLAFELARNTAMRCAEIRNLRWSDIDLMAWTLTIHRAGTKTNSGVRSIPLNSDAQRAILELREMAKSFADGQISPEWYLFARRHGQGTKPKAKTEADPAAPPPSRVEPTRPLSSWRTAWRALRAAAAKGDKDKGIPAMPNLASLRFHDLRHHVISRLAEGQTSDQTIMAIAGHVSPRMLAHYSHVRMEAKRRALDSLNPMPAPSAPGQSAPPGQGVMSQIASQNGLDDS
jgi:integrase